MATDIYNMLTGGYNPEDERRQQQQAFDQNLSRTTDPQAFIASVMSNMGSKIGQAVPNALGMPNKQQKIQKILQAVGNISDPLGQAQEAYKLLQQAGLVQEAQKVLQSIKGLQKEQDTLDQTAGLADIDFNSSAAVFEAAKNAFRRGDRAGGLALMQQAKQLKTDEDKTTARTGVVNRRITGITARNPEMPADFIPLVASEDDLFKEWSKSVLSAKEKNNNVSYQVVGNKKIMYVTDSAGNIVNQLELGAAPAVASTTVTMPAMEKASDIALGKVIGAGVGERMQSIITGAEKAEKNLPKMFTALKILKTQPITTGLGSSFYDIINQVRSQYLNDKAAGIKVENDQYLDSLIGGDVFNAIADLGIGARGIDTPAEKNFLLEVVTGKRTLGREALIAITNMRIKTTEENIIKFNTALEKGDLKKWEQAQGRDFTPIPLRSSGAAPTVSNW
tara:strand:- start:220 stop:1566 length:1347 start_codon:yes stop_codon:yes gene_type:complete